MHLLLCIAKSAQKVYCFSCSTHIGGVAEWSKALVLKTSVGQPTVSSNLTSSALLQTKIARIFRVGDFVCGMKSRSKYYCFVVVAGAAFVGVTFVIVVGATG